MRRFRRSAVVHWLWEVVGMAFVHGHARDTGWVAAHLRRPIDAEQDQIALPVPDEAVPRPREAPDDEESAPES